MTDTEHLGSNPDLPVPSAEGLQEVLAFAAAKREKIRRMLGDGPLLTEIIQPTPLSLAADEALVLWVLEKVFPDGYEVQDQTKAVEADLATEPLLGRLSSEPGVDGGV